MNGRDLVGRTLEVEVLQAALAATERGERPVLLFSGEPGIGKTRMLEELATRAVASHAVVGWGRVSEVGLTSPYWPWLQILNAIETPADPAPALGSLDTATGAGARLMRFGEVRAFLKRRAALAPLVLLFDDLHAADSSSLELLEDVLPGLLGCRALLALAARDADASPETQARLGHLLRAARRLPLGRLAAADVARLVGERAPAAEVFASSEGNPLYVEELVASYGERGTLGLPRLSSVRSVIRERVARFPLATREALERAAILGREFRGVVLDEMLAALPAAGELAAPAVAPGDALARLEPALALGVVVPAGPDRFRFSHALVAEAIAGELDAAARARLHLQAADALERRLPGESAAIAHQLLATGTLAAARAVDAAERAAHDGMARLAFEHAAALLERALDALVLVGSAPALRPVELMAQRVEALQHAARHAAAAELCESALERLRSAEAAGAGPSTRALFARLALARGLELRPGRTDPRLVELLSEALTRVPAGEIALHARLLARLAAAEQPAPDPAGPIARALEAIQLAEQLPPAERLDVTYVASAALVEMLQGERLEPLHRSVLALARGNRWVTTHTRLRLCFALLDQADRARFHSEAQCFEAEAAALGLPHWLRQAHLLRALAALLDGDFDRAEHECAQSEAISRSLGDASARWRLGVHRAMARWTQTAPLDAESIRHLTGETPGGRGVIGAWFALQAGDRESVRAALAEIGSEVSLDPDFAVMLGSATAFAGTREQAAHVYDTLLARRERTVLASLVGSAVHDLYERVLLELSAAAGRFDAIDGHARAALSLAERLGSPVWIARVQSDWADALERRAGAADAERARPLRLLALDAARRLNMPGLLAHNAERLAATPAASTPSQAGAAAHANAATPSAEYERAGGRQPAQEALRFEQRGALWSVSAGGEQIMVKDSRGLQMLARLVAEPGRALHALDLGGAGGADGGDAGVALDRTARDQYRQRLNELAAERDDAEASADRGRLERALREIDALGAELERAYGLGGRDRKLGAASERARSNVQRRISHALEQIHAAWPRLGEHLTASVRTGTYCVYQPRRRAAPPERGGG